MWYALGAPLRVCNPDMILNGDVEKKDPAYDQIVPDVYQEGRDLEVQSRPLALVGEPRWFRTAPLPKTLGDIPLSDQSVSLSLDFAKTTNDFFRLILKVHCSKRGLWREVEHRYTNISPFLFTFWADGVSIGAPMPEGCGSMGGINSMRKLAGENEVYESDLTIDPKSIFSLVPGGRPRNLGMVAAFAEAQHECVILLQGDRSHGRLWPPRYPNGFRGSPIVVRSNKIQLGYVHKKWEIVQSR